LDRVILLSVITS